MTTLYAAGTFHTTVEVDDPDNDDEVYTAVIERLPLGVELDELSEYYEKAVT
jgi:hypothetical protein